VQYKDANNKAIQVADNEIGAMGTAKEEGYDKLTITANQVQYHSLLDKAHAADAVLGGRTWFNIQQGYGT
jgi:hypothetical protein